MNDVYFGYARLAEITGIKIQTLYGMVHEKRIPHVRLSPRLVRFRATDINAWLAAKAVGVDDDEKRDNEKRVVKPRGSR